MEEFDPVVAAEPAGQSVTGHVRQLGGEALVYGIAGTVGRFISVLLIPLYTRVFAPSDYGLVAIIASLVTFLNMFIAGLDNAAGRWFFDDDTAEYRQKVIASWFWFQVIIGILIVAVMMVLAPAASGLLLDGPGRADLVRLAVLAIPLAVFNKVVSSWLRYLRRPWVMMIYSTVSNLGTIGLVVLFVLVWRQGLLGLYDAQLIAAALIALAAAVLLRSWINPFRINRQILVEMVYFGLPVMPAAIASWTTASADRFILRIYWPTAEIGLYAVAISISSAVAMVDAAFQMAWGPFAFSIYQRPNAVQVYRKVFSLYGWLGCWICTGVALFSHLLLQVFATPQYYAAASSIPFLVFSYLAIGVSYIVGIGANIAKKARPLAFSLFLGAGVNMALNFLLIPPMGKDGAALATLLAYAAASVYLYFASQKLYPIPYETRNMLICWAVAWALIGVDHFLLPPSGWTAFGIRVLMSLVFIPLAFWLEILRPEHVRRLYAFTLRRLSNSTV